MELKINDYKLLCNKGSANFNEDIIGLSPYGAWVLDGATGLNNKNLVSNESDAKWYVNWWNKYLHENMKRNDSLKEIMKDGIDEITKEYYKLIGDNKVESLDFPSCACSLVKFYEDKEALFTEPEQIREIERVVLLKVIDRKWMDHIDDMDQLKQGIGLQAYGQKDPVIQYKMMGYDMFDTMTQGITEDTVRLLMHIQVEQKVEREQVAKVTGTNKDDGPSVKGPVKRVEKKIYPNDPCPCGSGKKYKNCCGRQA